MENAGWYVCMVLSLLPACRFTPFWPLLWATRLLQQTAQQAYQFNKWPHSPLLVSSWPPQVGSPALLLPQYVSWHQQDSVSEQLFVSPSSSLLLLLPLLALVVLLSHSQAVAVLSSEQVSVLSLPPTVSVKIHKAVRISELVSIFPYVIFPMAVHHMTSMWLVITTVIKTIYKQPLKTATYDLRSANNCVCSFYYGNQPKNLSNRCKIKISTIKWGLHSMLIPACTLFLFVS